MEKFFPSINKLIYYFLILLFITNHCLANSLTKSQENVDYTTISLYRDGQPNRDVGEGLATYPEVDYETGEHASSIKRGEYLVKAGDCIGCHTEKNGKPFAGGLGFETPFGRIYSPNITPDKKTGIGKWTLREFTHTVQQGIAPHHKYLFPAFPYIYYNKITYQDLIDIKAYLNAIPPAEKKNKKNVMPFPFNMRVLQIGWRLLFFDFLKTNGYQPNPQHDEIWNRGAYLVQSLGHCDMCHTPMHYFINEDWVLGAPNRAQHLSGAYVSGFYAPNITRLFIKNITLLQFQNIFWKMRLVEGQEFSLKRTPPCTMGVRKGENRDSPPSFRAIGFANAQDLKTGSDSRCLHRESLVEGGQVQGPMFQAIHDSLQYLNAEDIQAIYTYLGTVKSGTSPKPHLTGESNRDGKKIYERYCKVCHETGKGPIPNAPKIDDTEKWKLLKNLGIDQLNQYAWHGLDGMPIRGTCTDCTYDEIKQTVQYMLKEAIPANQKANTLLPSPNGKRIYDQYCASCHNGNDLQAPKIGDQKIWSELIRKGMDTLILETWKGTKSMPPKGGCPNCNLEEIKAATKYLVNESVSEQDFRLW